MTDLQHINRLNTARLSPAIAERRDALRATLLRAVTSRRRRRVAARSMVGLVAVLGAALCLWPSPARPGAPAADPLPQLAHCTFAVTPRDSTRLDHIVLASEPRSAPAEWIVRDRAWPDLRIDDDTLLTLLASAERTTGLVRIGSDVELPDLALDRWSQRNE